MEKRASLVNDYELERRKMDILSRLSDHYDSVLPQLKDTSLYIVELKQNLQVIELSDLDFRVRVVLIPASHSTRVPGLKQPTCTHESAVR